MEEVRAREQARMAAAVEERQREEARRLEEQVRMMRVMMPCLGDTDVETFIMPLSFTVTAGEGPRGGGAARMGGADAGAGGAG